MSANDRFCNLLELCETPEAPICPLQEITIKNGIWYCDEPVCRSQIFHNLAWLKKQRAIAALGLKADAGFFTVRMLNAIHVINKDIRGADPDSLHSEKEWFERREEQVKVKSPVPKRRRKKAKKQSGKAVNKLQRKRLF